MNMKKWKASVRYASQDGVVNMIQNATSNYAWLTQLQERTDFSTFNGLGAFLQRLADHPHEIPHVSF